MKPHALRRAAKPLSLAPEDQVLDPSELWEPPPERGEGIPAATRVSSLAKRQIQEIVQSGHFRFRTENDLIRTATAWFLREKLGAYVQTGQVAGGLREQMALERDVLQTLAREKAARKQFLLVRMTVRAKLENQDRQGAAEFLEGVLARLRLMADQTWATAVIRLIAESPDLVDLASTAALGEMAQRLAELAQGKAQE